MSDKNNNWKEDLFEAQMGGYNPSFENVYQLININVEYKEAFFHFKSLDNDEVVETIPIKIPNVTILDELQLETLKDSEIKINDIKDLGEFNIINNYAEKRHSYGMKKFYMVESETYNTDSLPRNNYFRSFNSSHFFFNEKQFPLRGLYKFDNISKIKTREDLIDSIYGFSQQYNPVYMCYDIEVDCSRGFPSKGLDPVTHISIFLKNKNRTLCYNLIADHTYKNHELKSLFQMREHYYNHTHKSNSHEDIYPMYESEMLKFFVFLFNKNPDYIITYNGKSFDFPYILDRIAVLKMPQDIFNNHKGQLVKLNYHSKRSNKGFIVNGLSSNIIPIEVDVFNYVQENITNSPSFKLDDISKLKLKTKGHAISLSKDKKTLYISVKKYPKYFTDIIKYCTEFEIKDELYILEKVEKKREIYCLALRRFEKGPIIIDFEENEEVILNVGKVKIDIVDCYNNYSKRVSKKLSKYCFIDVLLTFELFSALHLEETLNAFVDTYRLPKNKIQTSTASVKIKKFMFDKCFEEKIVIDSMEIEKDKFPGGLCLFPTVNYTKSPTGVFDFKSLYPNSIKYVNISPETLVYSKEVQIFEHYDLLDKIKKKYKKPDYMIITSPTEFDDPKLVSQYDKIHIMVWDQRVKGFIPDLLDMFIRKRAEKRKQMAELDKKSPTYEDDYIALDKLQYFYKIEANSTYGLLSVPYFALQSSEGAKSCTAFSRTITLYLDMILNGSYIDLNLNKLIIKHDLDQTILDEKIYDIVCKDELFLDIDNETISVFKGYFKDHIVELERIYGDTDSLFIKLTSSIGTEHASHVQHFFSKINALINKQLLGTQFPFHRTEYEGFINNLIIMKKKKYMGEKFAYPNTEGSLYVKGMSLIKKGSTDVHKEIVMKSYELFINNDDFYLKIVKNIIEYFKDEYKLLLYNRKEFDWKKYLSIRPFNKYKEETFYLNEIIEKYNMITCYKKINTGERFFFIYCIDDIRYDDFKTKVRLSKKMIIVPLDYQRNHVFDIKKKVPWLSYYIKIICDDLNTFFQDKNVFDDVSIPLDEFIYRRFKQNF